MNETDGLLTGNANQRNRNGSDDQTKKKKLVLGLIACAVIVVAGIFWKSDSSTLSDVHAMNASIVSQVSNKNGDNDDGVDDDDGNGNSNSKGDGGGDVVTRNKSLKCEDGKYSKRTLQLAYELPFAALFRDNKGQKKYEASDVIIVEDNAYAVCDSSWAISKFGTQLEPFAHGNVQIGDPAREKEDSGYEAIFHEDGIFYVLRESIKHDDKTYHAIIEELEFLEDGNDEEYSIGQVCTCEFEFEGDSKGFEGAIAVHDLNGELVVLGLCEGNHCSESRKNDKGNGRLVAMRKETLEDGSCQWSTIRTIDIPKSANFRDYSAISLKEDNRRVAITSQEDSQIWLAKLKGQNEDGLWDIDAMEFDDRKHKVFDFPKDHQCETIYCNIEGIHWINDEMVIAVSDKMKSRGRQDFRCFEKDQSVHVFVIP